MNSRLALDSRIGRRAIIETPRAEEELDLKSAAVRILALSLILAIFWAERKSTTLASVS